MIKRINIIPLFITVYWFLMYTLNLTGVSLIKIIVTSLPLLAILIVLLFHFKYPKLFFEKVHRYAFFVFFLLVSYNLYHIVLTILDQTTPFTTTFGNPYNSMALLAPCSLVLGVHKEMITKINRFFLYSTLIGLCFLFFNLIFDIDSITRPRNSALLLLTPVVFLIGTVKYQNRTNKYLIYISSLASFSVMGLWVGNRSTVLRFLLLYLSSIVVIWNRHIRIRSILFIMICGILFSPYLVIVASVSSGQSIFVIADNYLHNIAQGYQDNAILIKRDSRTFLYQEVFMDLKRNEAFLLGKGANGTYYSPFFNKSKGDIDTRLTVEVGILAILLKGGLVAVCLNLSLIYAGIFLAIFRANNDYIRWMGFMLAVHTIILFAENLVAYNMYNFSVWFFVGACLSTEMRGMSNQDIKLLFKKMPKLLPRITW